MTAIEILGNGTIRAALLTLKAQGDPVDGTGALSDILKTILKSNLDKIMAEWKDATEARIGEAWLREMLNLQCNEYGRLAAEQYRVR